MASTMEWGRRRQLTPGLSHASIELEHLDSVLPPPAPFAMESVLALGACCYVGGWGGYVYGAEPDAASSSSQNKLEPGPDGEVRVVVGPDAWEAPTSPPSAERRRRMASIDD